MKLVSKRIVKEGKIQEVINLFKELADKSRQEPGCLSYELYQDQKDPRVMAIIEEWETLEILELHKNTDHFLKLVPILDELTENKLDFNIYNKLV